MAIIIPQPCSAGDDDYEMLSWCVRETATGDLFTVQRIIRLPEGSITSTILIRNSDGVEFDTNMMGFDWNDYQDCREIIIAPIEDYEVITWCLQSVATDDFYTVRRTIHMPDGAIISTILVKNSDGSEIDTASLGFDWADYRECEEIPVYPEPGAECFDGVIPFQPPHLTPNNMTIKNCGETIIEVSFDGGATYPYQITPGGEVGFGGSVDKIDLSSVWLRSEAGEPGSIEIIWEG